MPPRKRRRTCAPRRGSVTASPSPDTPQTPSLPALLLAEIAARTDAVTIFRCAAACKLFRREIINPSLTARVVCRGPPDGGIVPVSTLLGLLDKTFSLVHPSATPAAASVAENRLAPFVSRSDGAAGGLLERYEAVYILDYYHRELLVLDMETTEIRRIVGKANATGIPYEVDLASRLSAMKAF